MKAARPLSPHLQAQLQQAVGHHQRGELAQARALYEAILKSQPHNFDALHLLGTIFTREAATREQGVQWLDKALRVVPGNASARYNRGLALQELGRAAEALADYDRALQADPSHVKAHINRGVALRMLRRFDESLASYDRALVLAPQSAEGHYNRGNVLVDLRRWPEGLAAYEQALRLNPKLADAWFGHGAALRMLGQFESALRSFEQATRLDPSHVEAWAGHADAQVQLQRHDLAIASYDRVLALAPQRPFTRGYRLHARMHLCDWQDLERDIDDTIAALAAGQPASPGMPMLAATDRLAPQRQAAQAWMAHRAQAGAGLGPLPPRPPGERLKIGYFSMDFREHPVAILTAELIELHDRSRFEITAFSYGPPAADAMRQRLERAFDRFIDVRERTDTETAQIARDMGIDIAVDLAGLTGDARPAIFAARAAPVQVNYLGYPGTLPHLDVILADETLVPAGFEAGYAEKVVRLPVFQANDRRRRIAERRFTREELGLPAEGFVFCCFNKNYKMTPGLFAAWMRILAQVAGSVLVLYTSSAIAMRNLQAAARAHGIDDRRLVFAGRLPPAEYLARYRTMDLFLDTFPFNGGTTVSDALWAGLPVVTFPGEAYASRMGASLLVAAGLPELVCRDQAAYEALAVDLARDPSRLADLRARLAATRDTCALFDTPAFTRSLEAAYLELAGR